MESKSEDENFTAFEHNDTNVYIHTYVKLGAWEYLQNLFWRGFEYNIIILPTYYMENVRELI